MKKSYENYHTPLKKIIGILEDGGWGQRSFKEIVVENLPNPGKEQHIHVLEGNRSLYYLNAKGPSPRLIIMKLSKVKKS